MDAIEQALVNRSKALELEQAASLETHRKKMSVLQEAEDKSRAERKEAQRIANEKAMRRRIEEQEAEEKIRRDDLKRRTDAENATNLRQKQLEETAETNEALNKRRVELEHLEEQIAKAKQDAELIMMTKVEEPSHPLSRFLRQEPE
jgi:hypothetical protein